MGPGAELARCDGRARRLGQRVDLRRDRRRDGGDAAVRARDAAGGAGGGGQGARGAAREPRRHAEMTTGWTGRL